MKKTILILICLIMWTLPLALLVLVFKYDNIQLHVLLGFYMGFTTTRNVLTFYEKFNVKKEISNIKMENNKENGFVYIPYILKTVSTSINGETVWHVNKWKNLLLKIKRFFYKSKNFKNSEKYLNKKINRSFYTPVKITEGKEKGNMRHIESPRPTRATPAPQPRICYRSNKPGECDHSGS
jgi:hypothetical protein